MTFAVQGSYENQPYTATWQDGSLRADLHVLRALPVDGDTYRVTPTGPFMEWTEVDPVVVWAWLQCETKVTDVYGDPPAWTYPSLPAGVVG